MSPEKETIQPLAGFARHLMRSAGTMADLTGSFTRALVGRINRQIEKPQVWTPDMGSLSPRMVENFTGGIRERYPLVARKYAVETMPQEEGEAEAMVLPPISPVFTRVGKTPRAGGGRMSSAMPAAPGYPYPSESTEEQPRVTISSPPPVQRKPGVKPVSSMQMVSTPGAEAEEEVAAAPEAAAPTIPAAPPQIAPRRGKVEIVSMPPVHGEEIQPAWEAELEPEEAETAISGIESPAKEAPTSTAAPSAGPEFQGSVQREPSDEELAPLAGIPAPDFKAPAPPVPPPPKAGSSEPEMHLRPGVDSTSLPPKTVAAEMPVPPPSPAPKASDVSRVQREPLTGMPPGPEAEESPVPGEPEHISLPEVGQQAGEMQTAQAAILPPLPLAGLPENPSELHEPEKPVAAHPSLPQVQREPDRSSSISPAAAPPKPGARLTEPLAQPSGFAEVQPESPWIEPATQEPPEQGQEIQPLPLAPGVRAEPESPAALAAGLAGMLQETPAAPQAGGSLPTPPSAAATPDEGIAPSTPAAEMEGPSMQPAAELPLATILPAQPEIQRKVESASEAPAGIERHAEPGAQVKTAGGEVKEAVKGREPLPLVHLETPAGESAIPQQGAAMEESTLPEAQTGPGPKPQLAKPAAAQALQRTPAAPVERPKADTGPEAQSPLGVEPPGQLPVPSIELQPSATLEPEPAVLIGGEGPRTSLPPALPLAAVSSPTVEGVTIGTAAKGLAESKWNQFAPREQQISPASSPAILPQARNLVQRTPAAAESGTARDTDLALAAVPTSQEYPRLPLATIRLPEASRAQAIHESPAAGAADYSGEESSLGTESPGLFSVQTLQRSAIASHPVQESKAETEEEPDLDDLARKILPLIKQMLAVERERFSSR